MATQFSKTKMSVCVGKNKTQVTIGAGQFPKLLAEHLESDPTTPSIEKFAEQLCDCNFPLNRMHDFIRVVCRWGNDNRIGHKVIRDNIPKKIQAALQEANNALESDQPIQAMEAIRRLKGLGISFGSKHLKFLNPSKSVVLDSKIRKRLGYKDSVVGYKEFLEDCENIRNWLNDEGICATPSGKKWRVSAVEMAIFIKIQR